MNEEGNSFSIDLFIMFIDCANVILVYKCCKLCKFLTLILIKIYVIWYGRMKEKEQVEEKKKKETINSNCKFITTLIFIVSRRFYSFLRELLRREEREKKRAK